MIETVHLIETNRDDEIFKTLEHQLHNELLSRYGSIQEQYMAHDSLSENAIIIVAYVRGKPVGCGCLQERDALRGEIKRMFVCAELRNQQIAGKILRELEFKARERGLRHLLLETGIRQPESIALYDKHNYSHIESFRHGNDVEESIFFGKQLI